jgi:hypothetical protein
MVCDVARRWGALPEERQDMLLQHLLQFEERAVEHGVGMGDLSASAAVSTARVIVGAGSAAYHNLPRARNADGTFVVCPPQPFVEACEILRASWRRALGPSNARTLKAALDAAAADDARAAVVLAARQPLMLPPLQRCVHPGCGAWVWPCEVARCCGGGRYVLPAEQFPRTPPACFAAMYDDDYFVANSRFFNMRVSCEWCRWWGAGGGVPVPPLQVQHDFN